MEIKINLMTKLTMIISNRKDKMEKRFAKVVFSNDLNHFKTITLKKWNG